MAITAPDSWIFLEPMAWPKQSGAVWVFSVDATVHHNTLLPRTKPKSYFQGGRYINVARL